MFACLFVSLPSIHYKLSLFLNRNISHFSVSKYLKPLTKNYQPAPRNKPEDRRRLRHFLTFHLFTLTIEPAKSYISRLFLISVYSASSVALRTLTEPPANCSIILRSILVYKSTSLPIHSMTLRFLETTGQSRHLICNVRYDRRQYWSVSAYCEVMVNLHFTLTAF